MQKHHEQISVGVEMLMREWPKWGIGFLVICAGCTMGLSRDFRLRAAFAYHLVAGSDRSSLLKRDVDHAIAEAKAAVQSDDDKKAMQLLDHYVTIVEIADGTDADQRLESACQWEVAHALQTEEPYLGTQKVNQGDCQRLFDQRTDRVMAELKCTEQNADPIRDQATAAVLAGKSDLYDKLDKQRQAAEALCKQEAQEVVRRQGMSHERPAKP